MMLSPKLENWLTLKRINWLKPESSWRHSFFLDYFSLSVAFTATTAIFQALPVNQSLQQQTKRWNSLTNPQYRYCVSGADVLKIKARPTVPLPTSLF